MWQAYLQTEPRSDARDDWRTAQVVQAIYTFMNAFGKRKRNVRIKDCLLKFGIQEDDNYTMAVKISRMFRNIIPKEDLDKIKVDKDG